MFLVLQTITDIESPFGSVIDETYQHLLESEFAKELSSEPKLKNELTRMLQKISVDKKQSL